jgi:hypothetical protein
MTLSKAARFGGFLYQVLEFIIIAGVLWLLASIGESQERYPYCGGTGVAIVGHWPAYSCTTYDDKCQIVVIPCTAGQRAVIAFLGGHEIPVQGPVEVNTRAKARAGRGAKVRPA